MSRFKMPPKKPAMKCMYHEEFPAGKTFRADQVALDLDEMKEGGWSERPIKAEKVENEATAITRDQGENMKPDELVGMCKSLGYKVMTGDMFEAEMVKAALAAPPTELPKFDDHAMAVDMERRGMFVFTADALEEYNKVIFDSAVPKDQVAGDGENKEETGLDTLKARFNEDPESLNQDELIMLGKEGYSLPFTKLFNLSTMQDQIIAAMGKDK